MIDKENQNCKQEQIENMKYEAVVFDMDGVIFDSEQAVIDCWKEIAKKYNIVGIEEACRKCLGTNYQRTCEIMKETYGPDFPYEEYKKENSKLFHERYDGGRLPMKPGIREILEYLKKSGKKIALASSTRKEVVEAELRDAGLLSYFDALVCGDMVSRSKPFPDIYLKACECIGVEPAKTFAIEDSFHGIHSAYDGNLRPIMVPDLLQPTMEIKNLCYAVLPDLYEVIKFLEMFS